MSTDVILQLSGTLFGVDLDAEVVVAGGPLSFRLAPAQPIPFEEIWNAIDTELQNIAGFSLPDIAGGPWGGLFGAGGTVMPTLWIAPSGPGPAAGTYLQLDFSEPIQIGGTFSTPIGTITIEPNFQVWSLYFGYDQATGPGLAIRAKISTSSAGSAATSDKAQIVSYPFPVPVQPSSNGFQVNYLGLGQRIGPTVNVTGDDPLAAIFQQLETELVGTDPRTILTTLANDFYQPDRDWFIAADISLRGFRVRILFNDPVLYGLEITVSSSPPTFFSGLLFEILYQKLGPNLGVYYGALTLPMAMRRIVLDGVILILPGFSIWVYTNGDFRVNVGWPVGTSSIGVQVGPLIGWGGFYFAKLSSGDNPGAQPSVDYNPILAFGLGVTLSLNESFNASIFSATISVSLSATFQGLLAWEAGNSISGPPDHYWFAGTAGLSVLIQGTVDFAIIKASVTISFTANLGVAFETGYQTLVAVSASVSVSVSIHVIFFTIHLSFSTTVSTQWVIGSGTGIASVNGPQAPGLAITGGFGAPDPVHVEALRSARLLMDRMAATPRRAASPTDPVTRLDEASRIAAVSPISIPVQFVLQPTVVYDSPPSFNVIASLLLESPGPGSSPPASPAMGTPFERLIVAMVDWLLAMFPTGTLSERFAQVVSALGSGNEAPFDGDWTAFQSSLQTFLQSALTFDVTAAGSDSPSGGIDSVAVFPMLYGLQLAYVDENGDPQTIDFDTFNPTPADYPTAVSLYFADSQWSGSPAGNGGFTSPSLSMATFTLADYFLMQARNAANALYTAATAYEQNATNVFLAQVDALRAGGGSQWDLVDATTEHAADLVGGNELETLLQQFDYASAAGMGSRFLLNGLQLPVPADVPPDPTFENMKSVPTAGLYILTGQQYAIAQGATTATGTLSLDPSAPSGWITFDGGSTGAVSTIELPSSIPPSPLPQWQTGTQSPSAGTAVFNALPAVTSHPLYVSLKNQIAWDASGMAQTILALPAQVKQLLAGGVQLQITADPPASTSSGSPVAAPPLIAATPALLIRITLTQVPSNSTNSVAPGSPTGSSPQAEPQQYLPNIYQVTGADEETRDRIFAALQSGLSGASISLLYPTSGNSPGPSGLVSEGLGIDVMLVKTNLSTLNQVGDVVMAFRKSAATMNDDASSATVTEVVGFLELLWQVSVVNAPGFFLFYENDQGQDLPSSLFSSAGTQGGGTAQFDVLVQFAAVPAETVSVPQYASCIFIEAQSGSDPLYAGVLDADGAPLPQWFPTMPPGNVGFTVEWEPPVTSPNDLVPVGELYHLLQYQVQGSGGYMESVWSLPVGPMQNNGVFASASSPELWQYLTNVPVYLAYGTSPAEAPSPYAIVGTTVGVDLRIADVYGDVLPSTYDATFAPLYQDALISIAQWPGLYVQYRFVASSGNGQAVLEITATFDPDSVVPPAASPASPQGSFNVQQQWQTALSRYDLILYQLADPNVTVSVATSVAGGPVGDPTAIASSLYEFAVAIEEEIAVAMSSPDAASQVTRVISIDVPFAAVVAQTVDIFQVGVTMTFARHAALVDPIAAANLPGAVSVAYDVPADLTGDAASPNVTLFAQDFEAAFAGFDGASGELKLAQRSGVSTGSSAPVSESLWAVRFSATDGIALSMQPGLAYFALQPLSTEPLSGVAAGQTWSNVDIDAWAQQFLAAYDAFLSPQMAVAIAVLDAQDETSAYESLTTTKQQLANTVPLGLTQILAAQAGLGDLTAAQTRLTNAMLTQLGSAFSVSTIVQVPATVSVAAMAESPDQTSQPPQVYGALVPVTAANSSTASTYSFSPGEVVLAPGSQWMTSLLTVAQPGEQSSLSIGLAYQISYLQHDFLGNEAELGYTPSSWLKFVVPAVPLLQLPITAAADIPIPLIFEPSAPSLVVQSATEAPPGSPVSPNDIQGEIGQMLQWNYAVDMALALEAQDELHFDVTYNVPAAPSVLTAMTATSTAPLAGLFNALAEFRQWYAANSPGFGQIIGGVLPSTGNPPGSPSVARTLIDGFVSAAGNVASAWAALYAPPAFLAEFAEEQPIVDSFYLTTGGTTTMQLFGQTSSQANPQYWPSLTFADGTTWTPDGADAVPTGSGEVWWVVSKTFASVPDLSTLTIEMGPLNMLDRQTAILSSYVVRNATLAGQGASPVFVYTTQEVTFPSALVPLISRASMPVLEPAATLADTLTDVLAPIAAPGALLGTYARIAVSYAYAIAEQPSGTPLMVTTAVLLVDDVDLAASPGAPATIAASMAGLIESWHQTFAPPSTGALLTLALTLFASAQQYPIIEIDQIPIDVSAVDHAWWQGGT